MALGDNQQTRVDVPGKVPGVFTLLFLLLLRPVDLHYRLHAAGIVSPNGRIGQLWREQGEGSRAAGVYVRRMLLLLLGVSPAVTVLAGLLLRALGLPLVGGLAVSAGVCCALGLFIALVSGLAAGVLVGSLSSLSTLVSLHAVDGGLFGPQDGGAAGLVMGVCLGIVSGVSAGSIGTLGWGRVPSVNRVQLAAIVVGIIPMVVWGHGETQRFGAAVAAGALAAFLVTAFRLPLYLLEVLGQAMCFAVERWTGLPTLRWAPVLHHNLSYLPHPFLARHLALAARSRPQEVLEVANACLRSPGNTVVGWPWVVEAIERAEAAARGSSGET
ncbi:hypothetical protein P2318_17450 [Myxococcaceae bacterium GXIMD 01537]